MQVVAHAEQAAGGRDGLVAERLLRTPARGGGQQLEPLRVRERPLERCEDRREAPGELGEHQDCISTRPAMTSSARRFVGSLDGL